MPERSPVPPPLCVGCRKERADPQFRPFCSERCKMADLGRWLTGGYSVPGPEFTPEAPAGTAADDWETE